MRPLLISLLLTNFCLGQKVSAAVEGKYLLPFSHLKPSAKIAEAE